MTGRTLLVIAIAVQVLCAVFFVGRIFVSVLGLPLAPIDWQILELIEIAAALGLTVGVVVGLLALRNARRRSSRAEEALRLAQGAFNEVLEERFDEWRLTPAERDVALFAIKGMSTTEIAGLRGVSEGTVKAQTAAIYRKAGVSGRPQLLSLFIDELIDGAPMPQSSSAA